MTEYECTLEAAGVKRARDELGEIETDREAAVLALREWVLAQGDWLKTPTDTQFLLGFLRHRKFSQTAAKERLITFWETRVEHPEWFVTDPASPEIQDRFKSGVMQPLPVADKDGCTVVLVRMGLVDPKVHKDVLTNQTRALIGILDNLLRRDMPQVCGVKVFHDFTGVTIEHLVKMEGIFKMIAQVVLTAYPVRVNSVCFYNAGAVFGLLFTIVRKFFPKKIQDRISTHSTLQTVYDKIDMSVLPVEYLPDDYTGPHAGPIDVIVEKFAAEMKLAATRDYITGLWNGDYSCDVTKKPHTAVPTESFRSLQL